jgi:hypothetical protein
MHGKVKTRDSTVWIKIMGLKIRENRFFFGGKMTKKNSTSPSTNHGKYGDFEALSWIKSEKVMVAVAADTVFIRLYSSSPYCTKETHVCVS